MGAWIETQLPTPRGWRPAFCRVAPRVGAWIETGRAAPRVGAWLGGLLTVAPRVGAWIETRRPLTRVGAWMKPDTGLIAVAPRVGAWIETGRWRKRGESESHPAWVRGLKPSITVTLVSYAPSHPAWVRGLKPHQQPGGRRLGKSHPAWVRGLKLRIGRGAAQSDAVAPRVGAWIETEHHDAGSVLRRRTPRGCVD